MKTNLQLRIFLIILAMALSISNVKAQISPLVGQCTVTAISPTSLSAGSGAGQVSPTVSVTSQNNCTNYTMSNSYSWISYSQNGLNVTISVQSNSGSARTGYVYIGSQTLTVNQACGNPPTAPTRISTDRNNFCANAGGNITLTAIGGSGTTVRWFTGSCGGNAIGTGSPLVITAPTTSTTYYARWETSCGNSSCANIAVTVNTLPTPTISGNNTVCASSTGNVYTTESGMSGYSWTVTGGSITAGGGSTNNSVTVTWGTSGTGHVKVNYTNSGGCTAAAQTDKTITINAIPTPTISGPSAACLNSTGNVYTTESGMSGYSWTVIGGNVTSGGGSTNNSVTVLWLAVGTEHIKVNYSNSSGCTASSQTDKPVTVNDIPIPTISGSATVCAYSTGNVYTTESGMTGYSWTVIGGSVTSGGSSTNNSVTVTWNTSGTGDVKVNYTNGGGCTAANQTDKTITINALPAPSISGSSSVCANSSGNVYTTESGMSGYSWTVTGGSITSGGGSANNSVTVTWGTSGTGHVKVNYTNSGGCTAAAQTDKTITINAIPTPTISGPSAACLNSTGNVYTTESGMSGYSWTVIGGNVTSGGGSTNNSVTVLWLAVGTEHIKVNYSNSSGCTASSQTDKPVTVNDLPIPTISGSTTVCAYSTGNVYTTESGMSGYSWTVIGGSVTSGGGSANNTVTVNWNASGTGHVKVNYTNANGCAATTQTDISVTLNALPSPPSASSNQTFCSGRQVSNLVASPPTGDTINWYTTPSYGSPLSGNTVLSSGNTYYAASVNGSGCISSTRTAVIVTLNALPSPPTAPSPQTFCSGAVVTNISHSWPDQCTFTWYNAATGGSPYIGTETLVSGTYYAGSQNISTGCISSTRTAVSITVNTRPANAIVPSCQDLANEAMVSDLYGTPANGSIIKWFTSPYGSPLSGSLALISGQTYYANSLNTTTNCSSSGFATTLVTVDSSNINFVKSISLLIPGVFDDNQTDTLAIGQKNVVTSYFDGLGRPMQTVTKQGSTSNHDIVEPFIYDQFGREVKKYLPYTVGSDGSYKNNPFNDQYTFYQNAIGIAHDDSAFAKTILESSPLNRILAQGAPGTVWQPENGHVLQYNYNSNAQYDVLLWKIAGDSCINNGGETSNGHHYYYPNNLYKNVVKDENWTSGLLHTSEEYKDLQGNIVLKRSYLLVGSTITPIETYYIYDDLGLLRYVLPPESVNNLGTFTNFKQTSDIVKKWCYYYAYDYRKRMIVKQLPGEDPIYMVYDKRDRLVASQDGKMRGEDNSWVFTKYDALNRPVLTGKYQPGSALSLSQMQSQVDAFYADTTHLYYSSRTTTSANKGYNTLSFPQVDTTMLNYYTVTYYDDYTYKGVKSFDTSINISGYNNGSLNYFDRTRSLITGTKVLVLDGGTTYLTTTTYYDDKSRPIEVIRDLYDGTSNKETVSNMYDFIGHLLEAKVSQTFNNVTTSVSKYYTYDHMGRLLKSEQQIGDNINDRITLSTMVYNELGQLNQKNLHVSNTTELNTINYNYNIRGWLTGLNDPTKLKSGLFAMSLCYNDVSGISPLTTSSQYNGNISGIKWKSGQAVADTVLKGYGFIYDELNRLKTSDYAEGNSLTSNSDRYNESIGSYDLNGNINSLTRSGFENPTLYSDYDILSYTYNGNQLIGVEDAGQVLHGFIDGHVYSSGSHDYDYDYNGNMIKDLNKGIDTIKYNFLNLPSKVIKSTSNNIVYTYDAIGNKLKKSSTVGGTTTNRYYAGSFEYGNTRALELIHTDEGIANYNGSAFTYEYFLKDHLGNTRVTFKPNGSTYTLLQTSDYYPFGMVSNKNDRSSDNKYLYNGKELQDESLGDVNLDWYDYGARFYDAQIGRFNSIDPLAEYRLNISPYNYCKNNPILYIDLFGLIDTVKLPNVNVVAYRYEPEPPRFITFLYSIDKALEGNDNPSKVRDATSFEEWCIRHFSMSAINNLAGSFGLIGEGLGEHSTEATLNNKVRAKSSYEGTEDEEIQKKAGNNKKLIKNNIQYIHLLKSIDSTPVKAGILDKDANGNYIYFRDGIRGSKKLSEDDTVGWTVIRSYDWVKIQNGDTIK